MPPSKKSAAPKKAAKATAKKQTDQVASSGSEQGPVTAQKAKPEEGVVARNAVQPTTNTTNTSAEQHNSPALSEEAVRQRAYELYEQRGRTSGRHHEDWFRAEQEIRDRHRRTP